MPANRPTTNTKFPDTRWTVVLSLRANGDSPAGRKALAELCRIYWRPLYGHARYLGNEPADAEDLTQSFLLYALENDLLQRADFARGTLRSFLLSAFKSHIHNQHRSRTAAKRGGGLAIYSLEQLQETEGYVAARLNDAVNPDELYEYESALATIEAAVNELGYDETSAGRGELFEALRPYIDFNGSGDESMDNIARGLGLSYGAMRTALARLRKRMRACLRRAVADTLINPTEQEVDDELRHLKAVLLKGRPTTL